MVNQNIQGVVPLMGRGYSNEKQALNEPGCYSSFDNVVLNNGRIESRLPIRFQPAGDPNAVLTRMTRPNRIIGTVNRKVYFATNNNQVWEMSNNAGPATVLYTPGNVTASTAYSENFHSIVGLFEYNEKAYYLTYKHERDASFVSIHTFYLQECINSSFNATNTPVQVLTFTSKSATSYFAYSAEFFRGFFIYKERLWIVTSMGLYCSKATDPTDFTPAQGRGYFVKIRDEEIHDAFVDRDNVYLVCGSSIHVLSYTSDPNLDSYVRPVDSKQGGYAGISHLGNIYILSRDGLYTVSNGYLSLVRDDFLYQRRDVFTSDVVQGDGLRFAKLVAFDKYIFIIKYDITHLSTRNKSMYSDHRTLKSVFMYNTENGSISVVNFMDQIDGSRSGYIVDAAFDPEVGCIYFMTCAINTDGVYRGCGYYMYENEYNNNYDIIINYEGRAEVLHPLVDVVINGYTPDGNEYLTKKFRSFDFMGLVPNSNNYQFEVTYDNKEFPVGTGTPGTIMKMSEAELEVAGDGRYPYPFRFPLNQRAKSINFRFFLNYDPYDGYYEGAGISVASSQTADYTKFVLENLRVLWTYTQRGSTTRSPTLTT